MPLLSIVIANYNYGRFLETAITSVVNQCDRAEKCPDGINRLRLHTGEYVELIICDANSTDNSVEVIKKYEHCLAWWCSEKDKGQSDAFNKGFSHATGRFLTWLNADDLFVGNVFERLRKAVNVYPQCQWYAGGCIHVDPNLSIRKCTLARRFSVAEVLSGVMSVYSPSSFFSKDLFERVGGFDLRFNGTMDIDMWFRFYFNGHAKYQVLPGYVFAFRMHPQSRTMGNKFSESPLSDPNHENVEQGRKESRWMREKFPPFLTNQRMRRFISFDWFRWLRSKVDTWRFKGRNLNQVGDAV